jgi:hypothetical protein
MAERCRFLLQGLEARGLVALFIGVCSFVHIGLAIAQQPVNMLRYLAGSRSRIFFALFAFLSFGAP